MRDDKAFLALYRLLFYRHILANLNSAESPVTFAQFAEVRACAASARGWPAGGRQAGGR